MRIIHVCGCVNVFTFAVKFMWKFLHLSDLFLFLKYFSLKYFFYGWKQSTCTNMQPWKGNIPDKFFHAHEKIKRRTWKNKKERGRRVRDRETSRTWWGWSMKSSVTFNKTRNYRKNRHDKKVDFSSSIIFFIWRQETDFCRSLYMYILGLWGPSADTDSVQCLHRILFRVCACWLALISHHKEQSADVHTMKVRYLLMSLEGGCTLWNPVILIGIHMIRNVHNGKTFPHMDYASISLCVYMWCCSINQENANTLFKLKTQIVYVR